MHKRKFATVSSLRECSNCFFNPHCRKAHLVYVTLSYFQTGSLPKVPDALSPESEKAGSHYIGCQGIGAGDDKSGLDRITSQRAAGNHGGMAHDDREIDMKAFGHC